MSDKVAKCNKCNNGTGIKHSTRISTFKDISGNIKLKKTIYQCLDCNKFFTPKNNNIFPNTRATFKLVLACYNAVEYTHNLDEAMNKIKEKYNVSIAHSTISDWYHLYDEYIFKKEFKNKCKDSYGEHKCLS